MFFFLGTLHARKHPFSRLYRSFRHKVNSIQVYLVVALKIHPKCYFLFCSHANYIRGEINFCAISQLEVFVWKRLCIETTYFLSFACPIFAYSGETLQESSKIFVDTVPMPGLIAMTLVQWAQLWLSVYQQTDARTRDKTVQNFRF